MCTVHGIAVRNETKKAPVITDPLRIDPSRTSLLRRSYMKEMSRRFANLRTAIDKWVGEQDELGLTKTTGPKQVFNKKFEFATDADKVAGFRDWFQGQIDRELLAVLPGTKDPWTAKYVDSAHRQGVLRAFIDTNKEALSKNSDFYAGTREQFLKDAFNAPEMVSKVQLLHTRSFDDLKDISSTMSKDMNRILADGIANGKGPRELARELKKGVSGLEKKRAMTIARTEIIHAHAEGQLDGFEQLGVEEIGVMAEILTAGDDRVCPICQGEEGNTYTVKEARGLIPFHPNCRCAYIPSLEETRPKKGKGLFLGKKNKVDPQAPLQELFGYKTTAVIRRLGAEGWNAKDTRIALENMGVPNIAEATIKTQLYHGRKGSGGDPAALTADQLKQLLDAKLRGGPAKPPLPKPEPTPKPLPVKVEPLKPAVKPAPEGVTFTGIRTKLTDKVHARIGDGLKTAQDARDVGKILHKDIRSTELPGGHKLGETLDGLKKYTNEAKKYHDSIIKELDKNGRNSPLYDELYNKWREVRDKREEYIARVSPEIIRDTVYAKLQQVRDFKQTNLTFSNSSSVAVDAVNQQTKFHPLDWMVKVRDNQTLQSEVVERGFYKGSTNQLNISGDSVKELLRVAAHELGHAAEYHNKNIGELQFQFLSSRVKKGESLKEIYKDSGEYGYKDDFLEHYMGKTYGSTRHFEILTMGAERLADERCADLMLKDPDYFEFILGLMAGA